MVDSEIRALAKIFGTTFIRRATTGREGCVTTYCAREAAVFTTSDQSKMCLALLSLAGGGARSSARCVR